MNRDPPSVLIVEDSLLIALEVKRLAERCGCSVYGPVGGLDEALTAVRELRLDGAILDVNLGEVRVWPVAELLVQRRVPIVLATGYGEREVPDRFRDTPLLSKPLNFDSLGRALRQVGVI